MAAVALPQIGILVLESLTQAEAAIRLLLGWWVQEEQGELAVPATMAVPELLVTVMVAVVLVVPVGRMELAPMVALIVLGRITSELAAAAQAAELLVLVGLEPPVQQVAQTLPPR